MSLQNPTSDVEAPASPVPKTFAEEMGSDIVTLIVGPEKHLFSVHRTKLCNKIEYFRKMFMGGFREASTKTASFPEDHRSSFDLMLRWVYSGELPLLAWTPRLPNDYRTREPSWDHLDLYALGDKLGSFELMDCTFNAYAQALAEGSLYPDMQDITDGYSRTPDNSPLRRFLCSCFIHNLVSGREGWDEAPSICEIQLALKNEPDLAQDMVPMLIGIMGDKYTMPNASGCKYHSHPDAEICPWIKVDKSKKRKAIERVDRWDNEEEDESNRSGSL